MEAFLARCFYQPGQYKEADDFTKLSDRMTEIEGVGSGLPASRGYLVGGMRFIPRRVEKKGGGVCLPF